MKSFTAALLLSVCTFLETTQAVEHVAKLSTADFQEEWADHKPHMGGMNQKFTKVDHERRPVIGILTEPLRGQMFETGK